MEKDPTVLQSELIITDHADGRTRKRIGIKRKGVSRQADKAFENGLAFSDTDGALARFMTALYHKKKANNIRIFNRYVYIFKGDIFITVFPLPQKYVPYADKLLKRKENAAPLCEKDA